MLELRQHRGVRMIHESSQLDHIFIIRSNDSNDSLTWTSVVIFSALALRDIMPNFPRRFSCLRLAFSLFALVTQVLCFLLSEFLGVVALSSALVASPVLAGIRLGSLDARHFPARDFYSELVRGAHGGFISSVLSKNRSGHWSLTH